MSNTPITKIKLLRENFIRKYSLKDNYFTVGEKINKQEEEIFNDGQLFYPKPFERKNNYQSQTRMMINNKIKTLSKQQIQRDKIRKKANQTNRINLLAQGRKTNLSQKGQQKNVISKYCTIPVQSNFIKTQKLKRRVVSARQKRSIPKYAAQIMKPCSIQPIKIQNRPKSAYTRAKILQNTHYKELKTRRKQLSQDLKEPTQPMPAYFLPWQTQNDDF